VGETIRLCRIVVAGRRSHPHPAERSSNVSVHVAVICFPVIFLAELPDKTMFASLLMATRGRPAQVWLGAAGAFLVHVAIATTVGVVLFAVLPRQAIDGVVAALFLFGALYAWREGTTDEGELVERERTRHGVVLTAFVVIFLAEWGDLTQILTANLAAKYHAALAVGAGSVLALWGVAGIAVASGQRLLRLVDVATVRKITAVVLVGLAGWSVWEALH
jgi:Ca2+/H+ antiporter, TMEM165/GDT1 family